MKKTSLLLTAAALVTAGCSVDATKLTCVNSSECPSGYHCDMGTGSAAGSFRCANGAPQQKTLTVDATKFLLSQQSFADGTVRTTISGDVGAVTGTPDLVGVSAIAAQSGTELGSGKVLADGSVLAFQLAQAGLQVDLRVQDDSGHSVPVTGYREHLELNFLGKNVAGNKNGMAAFDAASISNSLFQPQTFISTGGVTGVPLSELAATHTVLPDGGISPSTSYQAIAQFDGVIGNGAPAPQPDRDGGTVIGWEQLTNVSTTTTTVTNPPARVGGAFATDGSRVVVYGGAAPDVDGGVVDPAGTWYEFNPNAGIGWSQHDQPLNSSTDPISSVSFGNPGVGSPSGRANAAVSALGGNLCLNGATCTQQSQHQILVAGGTTNTGALSDRLYAFGDRVFVFTGGQTTYRGWWDVSLEFGNGAANKLPVPNAGMANAATFIQVPSSTTTAQFHTGLVLIGGVNVPAGAGATAWDSIGCQVAIGNPSGSITAGAAGTVFSCTTAPEFTTTTGTLGFRTGVALAPSDQQNGTVFLFGGNRTGATTTTNNGFKNDLWQGIIDTVCNPGAIQTFPCPAGTTAQARVRWAPVAVAGTARPTPRVNAGLAFADAGRLTVYGGTDASGNVLTDVWELDVTAASPSWRQVSLDPAPALAPSARTKFSFVGWNLNYANFTTGLLISGLVGTSPSMEVWALSKQAPARLIVKAPVKLPHLDTATNLKLAILSFGQPFQAAPLYAWDGTAWRFVSNGNFLSGAIQATLPNATGFIQADGNVYLMYMHRSRSTPGFANNATIGLDSLQVFVDFN